MPNPIVHFEIPADDVARARVFYEKVFGWKIKQFPMPPGGPEYYGVTTRKEGEPGIDGGLMKRNMPGQPFANYVSVKSIDPRESAGAQAGEDEGEEEAQVTHAPGSSPACVAERA